MKSNQLSVCVSLSLPPSLLLSLSVPFESFEATDEEATANGGAVGEVYNTAGMPIGAVYIFFYRLLLIVFSSSLR